MRFILASGSPRRKEILTMLGVSPLEIIPARGEEKADASSGPEELVCALARAKAAEVAGRVNDPEAVVIAADTIVWNSGRVFGKPAGREQAAEMLRSLSGREHSVYTGVCIIRGGQVLCRSDESRVSFLPLSEREIEGYIATGEPMDKAGAYGIQGKASLFIDRMEGDFFNVMGMPVCLFGQMLKELGVELF